MRKGLPTGVVRAATVIGAYGFLAWLGGASVAASEAYADGNVTYPWNDRVDLSVLWSDMLSMSIGEVYASWTSSLTLPLTGVVMLGLTIVGAAHVVRRSVATLRALVAVVVISAPYGLLGLVTLGGPYDGEWLAEGWPLFQSFTLWWLAIVAVAFWSWRTRESAKSVVTATPVLSAS